MYIYIYIYIYTHNIRIYRMNSLGSDWISFSYNSRHVSSRKSLSTSLSLTHTQTHKRTHTNRHTNAHTHRHTDTQTHRHTDTQTHRNTDIQTHRHTTLMISSGGDWMYKLYIFISIHEYVCACIYLCIPCVAVTTGCINCTYL